ncbi:hypothetical protein QUW13_10975 [Enterococcus hirae]|nr:hypothetical protein [Enterococcus hirae]
MNVGLGIALLTACSPGGSKNSINGTWNAEINGSEIELTVNKEDAVFTADGIGMNGTVDRQKKEIKFKDDKKIETAKYKLVGDKLTLTQDNTTFALNRVKVADAKVKTKTDDKSSSDEENASSNVKVSDHSTTSSSSEWESYYLDLGDHEVGSDVKAGTYQADFIYRDADYKSASGTGKITIISKDGKSREYTFTVQEGQYSSAEQRIILKKGDVITLSSDGPESDFNFSSDF